MMKSIHRPRGVRRSWQRLPIENPAPIDAMLRELGFVFSDGIAVAMSAWADDQGKIRRVEARYSDGGFASLRIDAKGGGVLRQGLERTFKVKPRESAA